MEPCPAQDVTGRLHEAKRHASLFESAKRFLVPCVPQRLLFSALSTCSSLPYSRRLLLQTSLRRRRYRNLFTAMVPAPPRVSSCPASSRPTWHNSFTNFGEPCVFVQQTSQCRQTGNPDRSDAIRNRAFANLGEFRHMYGDMPVLFSPDLPSIPMM